MAEQLPLFSNPPVELTELKPTASAPGAQGSAKTALTANASLRAAIVAWREHLRQEGKSEHTVKAFGGDLVLLDRFLDPARKVLGRITTRDLDNWLQAQRAGGMSPKSYSRRVTSLKAFFRWLHQTGVLPGDPAAPIIQHTVLSPLPDYLTEGEVNQALAGAEQLRTGEKADLRPYVLFTLLLQTGIKKGECLALVPNHLDLSNPGEPVLWVRYPDPRQRFKERKLRLDLSWMTVYQAYRAFLDQYEQTSRRKRSAQRKDFLFPWSARQLEYLLADIQEAAGLTKEISFDTCRWTCAVREARAGMDHDKIRQKLGLSKIQWREIGMKLKKLVEPGL